MRCIVQKIIRSIEEVQLELPSKKVALISFKDMKNWGTLSIGQAVNLTREQVSYFFGRKVYSKDK